MAMVVSSSCKKLYTSLDTSWQPSSLSTILLQFCRPSLQYSRCQALSRSNFLRLVKIAAKISLTNSDYIQRQN